MNRLGSILLGSAVLLASAALAGWFVWRTVQKSEDPGRIVYKWIATAIIFGMLLFLGGGLGSGGPAGAFVVPIGAAVFGVVLGILWAPHLGALLATPFTSFYDGGDTEVEARPFYSIARAKQKQGRYPEALAEARKQLERFPEDYEGWMLLAEVYGDNLKDNPSAQECVDEILSHRGHHPKNVTFALNRAADWQLSLASDREAARSRLESIVELHPGSDFANIASQRLAHLASDQMLADQKERPRIALTRHEEKIGLLGQSARPAPAEESPEHAAGRLVGHLNLHPLDAEAREQLADLYARHYQRIELATGQLEELIASPGVSQKQIARWLNVMADYHLALGPDRPAAEQSLRRLIERFPDSAAAANAEKRIAYLDHELRRNRGSAAIPLGAYEENIGLKGRLPRNPAE